MTASFTCTTTTTALGSKELFDRSRSIDAHTSSMRFSRERAIGGVKEGLGVTTMVDRVEFTAPLGIVGSVAERILLRPYLRYLITVRNRFLTAEPPAAG